MSELRPQGRAEIRRLLDSRGLVPRQALGQNFLADPNIVDRMVSVAAVGPGGPVVEIGAGTGTLTKGLLGAGAAVTTYEIDGALANILASELEGLNVTIHHADATRIDWATTFSSGEWTMVANLPYNVGTSVLLDALRYGCGIRRVVAMVQFEVAQRLVAEPGSRIFGVPSVVAQLFSAPTIAFRVPASAFIPQPQVDSAVVAMDRIIAAQNAESAIGLAKTAFGQRRKMLRNSLAGLLSESDFAAASIDPTARPEELDVTDFVRLSDVMA